jgi:hypothetical protein
MPRFIRQERRTNKAQRAAVEELLAGARGATSVVRGADGSVFVYDDQRAFAPPRTLRARVTPDGLVERDSMAYRHSAA